MWRGENNDETDLGFVVSLREVERAGIKFAGED